MSKIKYKVANWPLYNKGLKQRGAISIWIPTDVQQKWRYQGPAKRGGQYLYSDWAIEFCLAVHLVYHLPLRQTQGFVQSYFAGIHVELPVPDYTSICRRAKTLKVAINTTKSKAITDIVVDSTGLKVYGEGEWKVRMHGWSKHRRWMKLHIALDADSQQIEAVELSSNAVDDAAEVEGLLDQIHEPINSFTGDGGYDRVKVRKLLEKRAKAQKQDILQVIVPRHDAVADKKKRRCMKQRDNDIAFINSRGREQWKVLSNYHQRSKAETSMYRYKVSVGGKLRAREFSRQQTEVKLACKILNIMLDLAKPITERVA